MYKKCHHIDAELAHQDYGSSLGSIIAQTSKIVYYQCCDNATNDFPTHTFDKTAFFCFVKFHVDLLKTVCVIQAVGSIGVIGSATVVASESANANT
jgi:hypothetical protein